MQLVVSTQTYFSDMPNMPFIVLTINGISTVTSGFDIDGLVAFYSLHSNHQPDVLLSR